MWRTSGTGILKFRNVDLRFPSYSVSWASPLEIWCEPKVQRHRFPLAFALNRRNPSCDPRSWWRVRQWIEQVIREYKQSIQRVAQCIRRAEIPQTSLCSLQLVRHSNKSPRPINPRVNHRRDTLRRVQTPTTDARSLESVRLNQ